MLSTSVPLANTDNWSDKLAVALCLIGNFKLILFQVNQNQP